MSLAGREVQRYAYQRTGSLLPIAKVQGLSAPPCCLYAVDLGRDAAFWNALNVSADSMQVRAYLFMHIRRYARVRTYANTHSNTRTQAHASKRNEQQHEKFTSRTFSLS